MNYILINISKTISRQNLRNQWSSLENAMQTVFLKKLIFFLLKFVLYVFLIVLMR